MWGFGSISEFRCLHVHLSNPLLLKVGGAWRDSKVLYNRKNRSQWAEQKFIIIIISFQINEIKHPIKKLAGKVLLKLYKSQTIFVNWVNPNMVINIELVSPEEIQNIRNQENLESGPEKGLYKYDIHNYLFNLSALTFGGKKKKN